MSVVNSAAQFQAMGAKYGVPASDPGASFGEQNTYTGPTGAHSITKSNLSSTAFNFYNKEMSEGKGLPQAQSKATMGTVYEGSIGSDA